MEMLNPENLTNPERALNKGEVEAKLAKISELVDSFITDEGNNNTETAIIGLVNELKDKTSELIFPWMAGQLNMVGNQIPDISSEKALALKKLLREPFSNLEER
jgi:hypothetical protein